MSLAVFTDSTTAQASPAFTLRPVSGNSTKTTSVNSCWAWSLTPTVAIPPATRAHSCDFAYLKSAGTLLIDFSQKPPQLTPKAANHKINFSSGKLVSKRQLRAIAVHESQFQSPYPLLPTASARNPFRCPLPSMDFAFHSSLLQPSLPQSRSGNAVAAAQTCQPFET